MNNLEFFIISYNECRGMVVEKLSEGERDQITCYLVNQSYPNKIITGLIKKINEWDLNWHDESFQDLQYYEYSLMAHIYKNPEYFKEISILGNLHYDTIFYPDSINNIRSSFLLNPNQIMYMGLITDRRSLYMSKEQLENICLYLSEKMKIFINSEMIWNFGWPSHSMIIGPKYLFENFGKFMVENKEDLEDIIKNHRWGLRGHRICGLLERMWGFYLASSKLPMSKIKGIIHDGSPYEQAAWGSDLKNKLN